MACRRSTCSYQIILFMLNGFTKKYNYLLKTYNEKCEKDYLKKNTEFLTRASKVCNVSSCNCTLKFEIKLYV